MLNLSCIVISFVEVMMRDPVIIWLFLKNLNNFIYI